MPTLNHKPVRPHTMRLIAPAALALALMSAPAAFAQTRALPLEILLCQDITDNSARLNCFDRLASQVSAGASNPSAAPYATPTPSQTYAPATVGAPMPSAAPVAARTTARSTGDRVKSMFGLKEKKFKEPEIDDSATYTIIKVDTFDYIKRRFTMANGQVWETITGANVNLKDGPQAAGRTAKIEKGALGGYRLKTKGSGKVKVKRVK